MALFQPFFFEGVWGAGGEADGGGVKIQGKDIVSLQKLLKQCIDSIQFSLQNGISL